jgi:tripartite-type tricarboxylate transporter receptor subunit TctC
VQLGFEPYGNTPKQFTEFIKSDNVKWGEVAHDLKIQRNA